MNCRLGFCAGKNEVCSARRGQDQCPTPVRRTSPLIDAFGYAWIAGIMGSLGIVDHAKPPTMGMGVRVGTALKGCADSTNRG